MKIQEIIIVEGRDDTTKVQQAVEADTIETNGSDINHHRLEQIKHAHEKRGVIIFTDPDYAGERIRQIIDESIPGCKHAFLTKEKAIDQRAQTINIGIEHASKQDIQEALAGVYERKKRASSMFNKQDLFNNGLIGTKGAKQRRKTLGEVLKIGHTNGKQLLKRLQMFHICKEEFKQAMAIVRKEESHDY